MNISEAKEEIKRTVEIYLDRSDDGEFSIPFMKQRPIFMMGAPGIGKTAIVEQIASEMNIGLVSYSMTHHTRQSAIGLPYIETAKYGDTEARISRYTMSEIIASVYDLIERSGRANGILFLDEINCVSETLAPAILQFLQYKTFGNMRLPQGWVIVSAGNPPEYNRSVREFDIATRDRLKIINIEENYEVWRKYAYDRLLHGSILSFLEINKSWFYSIRTTTEGPVFATARGWEDLSYAIKLYEKKSFKVTATLVTQYITDSEIGRRFAVFYDLYKKYREDYEVDSLLSGSIPDGILKKTEKAAFDERIALIEMIAETLNAEFASVLENQAILERVAQKLRPLKKLKSKTGNSAHLIETLYDETDSMEKGLKASIAANSASSFEARATKVAISRLVSFREMVIESENSEKEFTKIKKSFDSAAKKQAAGMDAAGSHLENAFAFLEKAFGDGQEMNYFLTVMTAGSQSSSFISVHGSESYFKHNETLLVYDAEDKLKSEILSSLEL